MGFTLNTFHGSRFLGSRGVHLTSGWSREFLLKNKYNVPLSKLYMSGFGFKTKKDTFKYTGTQRPGILSPKRTVPDSVIKPDYWSDGKPKVGPSILPWVIPVNSAEDIAGMRVACRMAREILDMAGRSVKAGISTDDIDRLVHEETVKRGAYPSPLNYHGFPKSVCTSINEIICHGIPSTTNFLKEGDIINIDVTVFYNGYHGDCSEMFCVGEVDEGARRLIRTAYRAWQAAIAICKPGVAYSDIGGVIEDISAKEGMSTSRDFCGHGVGKVFHDNPQVLHYRDRGNKGVMAAGHIFTIEPMINEGRAECVTWADNWTAATKDGKRSAQFEHTLLITEAGVEALTGKTPDSPRQWWELE